MGKLRESFGKRLRLIRKSEGLTLDELAGTTGLDPSYLGEVERGRRNLTIDNIEKIAKGFNIEAYRLFLFHAGGVDAKNEKALVSKERIADIVEHMPEKHRRRLMQIVHLCSELREK
ncbi:MAG: helix-turn-helix transcriptional regulator [Nitrospinae bacterium]|nr:helix-turn-helix transcriptional regulator [Nitrospinota bacterium]